MIKVLSLIAVFFLAFPNLHGQISLFYPGGSGGIWINGTLPLPNGDVVAVGHVLNGGLQRAMVMKLDANGQLKWISARNDTTYSSFHGVAARPDGKGYVLSGLIDVDQAVEFAAGLAALCDTNGNFSRMRLLGSGGVFREVRAMPDGGYHFGGATWGLMSSYPAIFVRADSNLLPLQQSFTLPLFGFGFQSDQGTMLNPTADGWGTAAHCAHDGTRGYLSFTRISPNATGSVRKIYNIGDDAYGRQVFRHANGGYLLLADVSFGGIWQPAFVRLDASGNLIGARKVMAGTSLCRPREAYLTQPDSLLVWGQYGGVGQFLLRADTSGNVAWIRSYQPPAAANWLIEDATRLPNGNLLLTMEDPSGAAGLYLFETSATGVPLCLPASFSAAISATSAAVPASLYFNATGFQTIPWDSLIHPIASPVALQPLPNCSPPCQLSIQANPPASGVCPGSTFPLCHQNPFASPVTWTFNAQAAGSAQCISVVPNALGNTDTIMVSGLINGCPAADTLYLQVSLPQAPSFSYTTGSGPYTVNFQDNSPFPVSSQYWQFGDGLTSTANNPNHTYPGPGTYTVCFTPGPACTPQSSCIQLVLTCPPPASNFSFSPNGLVHSFSAPVNSPASTYVWNFGNGNGSTAANPVFAFSAPGSYQVCLSATNSCGTTQSCSTVVATCAAPLAQSSFTNSPGSLQFGFSGQASSPLPVGFTWSFGDGTLGAGATTSHTYAYPGIYQVCLIAQSACGSDTVCNQVTASCPAPGVAFTSSGNQLAYAFTSSVSGGLPPYSYSWDFGDGGSSLLPNPSHTYNGPGVYSVCLSLSDICGTGTACSTVVVTCSPPVAAFSLNYLGPQWAMQSNASTVGNASYSWDFGDGTSAPGPFVLHTYALPGNYTICLTVSDICGTDSTCTILSQPVGMIGEVPDGILIWPVPASGAVNLQGVFAGEIRLCDLQGRVLAERTVEIHAGETLRWDLPGLCRGAYLLEYMEGTRRFVKRLAVE